jgi:hypothetical protein
MSNPASVAFTAANSVSLTGLPAVGASATRTPLNLFGVLYSAMSSLTTSLASIVSNLCELLIDLSLASIDLAVVFTSVSCSPATSTSDVLCTSNIVVSPAGTSIASSKTILSVVSPVATFVSSSHCSPFE